MAAFKIIIYGFYTELMDKSSRHSYKMYKKYKRKYRQLGGSTPTWGGLEIKLGVIGSSRGKQTITDVALTLLPNKMELKGPNLLESINYNNIKAVLPNKCKLYLIEPTIVRYNKIKIIATEEKCQSVLIEISNRIQHANQQAALEKVETHMKQYYGNTVTKRGPTSTNAGTFEAWYADVKRGTKTYETRQKDIDEYNDTIRLYFHH